MDGRTSEGIGKKILYNKTGNNNTIMKTISIIMMMVMIIITFVECLLYVSHYSNHFGLIQIQVG